MYLTLLRHEIKNFFRNPSFATNLVFKILMWIGWFFLALYFVGAAFLLFFYAQEDLEVNPAEFASRWFIYLWLADLAGRFIIQQMPTNNIKPYLTLNITKKKLVNYSIIKTFLSFFNWSYLLVFIPFFVLLVTHGYSFLSAMTWCLSLLCLLIFNNFVNILLNGKKYLAAVLAAIGAAFYFLEYYDIFSITDYSSQIFFAFYEKPWLVFVPILALAGVAIAAYRLIYSTFYLDSGLKGKNTEAKVQNIKFLDKYGVLGSFLKNDIRLILRNKYPRQVLFTGVLFLFYGMFIYVSETYQSLWFKFLAGLIVTGGFSMTFGAKVPSWDSAHYPLMLTQNVSYKEYLESKWWLMVIATAISIVLASFYLLIDVEYYLIILVAGIYNLGVNSHLTLLGGAYVKSPVDLNAKAKSFGDKNAFNLRSMLLSFPKMILPMAVFLLLYFFVNSTAALIAIALMGVLGFLLKNKIFDIIIKTYKSEKYMTLQAYKNNG